MIWGVYYVLSSIQAETIDELPPHQITAERISHEPIITTNDFEALRKEVNSIGYSNINGPSLIRTPKWLDNPLGQYYLYFAHHKGEYIRMAYADSLLGPWHLYDKEILPIEESGFATHASATNTINTLRKHNSLSENIALYDIGSKYQKAYEERAKKSPKTTSPTTPHVASPDVVVDHKNQKIRMYYHGVVEGSLQKSKVALSEDGLSFKPEPNFIGLPYLRMFNYKNKYYGLAMPGFLYKSIDGLKDFQVRKRWLFPTNHRHHALYRRGDYLYIFYTNVGDAPESIKYTAVDLSSEDWNDWRTTQSLQLMTPKLKWEGVELPITPSIRGEVGQLVRQLRDPAFFEDDDGRQYLLYTGGGEQAIGVAQINVTEI